MKHYTNINDLDKRIENIIKRTVKSYYTDWKNYDRPKYMGLKGSRDRKDKMMILIARKYGTYLLTLDEIATRPFAATVYDYYQEHEGIMIKEIASYFHVSMPTVTSSLRKLSMVGLCDYTKEKAFANGRKRNGQNMVGKKRKESDLYACHW